MKTLITLAILLGFGNAFAANNVSGEYAGFVSSTWSRTNGADCSLFVDAKRGYFSVGAGSAQSGPMGGFAFTTNDAQAVAQLKSPNATVEFVGRVEGVRATLVLKTDANGQITSYESYANKSPVTCIGLQKVAGK